MTGDEYLRGIIAKYSTGATPHPGAEEVRRKLYPIINEWAGGYLISVELSGSCRKGTGVKGGTDVDLFVSLSSSHPDGLKVIYETLFQKLGRTSLSPRRQNVSLGIVVDKLRVDVVPAKRQTPTGAYHSLYRSKVDSWTQTNVDVHARHVIDSKRVPEIIVMKRWRDLHRVDIPSFVIELATIKALSGKRTDQLANNVLEVLGYLETQITDCRLIDPANTNNVVTDDMTAAEKSLVAASAARSRQAKDWSEIVQ